MVLRQSRERYQTKAEETRRVFLISCSRVGRELCLQGACNLDGNGLLPAKVRLLVGIRHGEAQQLVDASELDF